MKIYKFSWEERTRDRCKVCCTEENHPWIERYEISTDSKHIRSRYDSFNQWESSGREYRNALIWVVEVDGWTNIGSWEIPR